jgi:osmotically-inducible protein OsmY
MKKACWTLLPVIAAIGGLAVADEASDKAITRQVRQLIAQHADLGTQLHAKTKDGVVYLTGRVSTGLAKSNAEDLVKGVPGVTKVIDNAEIPKGG